MSKRMFRRSEVKDVPRWFVMLRGGDGVPQPLIDEDGSVLLFDSEREALGAGGHNRLGQAYGFEVYEW